MTTDELAFWGGDLLQEARVVLALRALEAHRLEEGHRLLDGPMEHQKPAQQMVHAVVSLLHAARYVPFAAASGSAADVLPPFI